MNNWPTKKLGEVLELCDAGTWGKEDPSGMPLLRSSNMQNGRLILDDLKHIDVPKNKKEYYTLIEGDILITKSSGSVDHIGKSLYITNEMDGIYGFSNFTQRLRVNRSLVDPKWIYLKISNPSTRSFLLGASQTTTGLRNLKISALKELKIPLPPLEIQKKIVKKIEELFTKITQAQSLRESAIQDTNNLIPATLSKIFEEGKKKGWEEKELGDVLVLIQNGINAIQSTEGKYPISRIETIQNSFFDQNRVKRANLDNEQLNKFKYKNGDIAFSHINSWEILGKVAIYEGTPPNLIHGVNLLRLRTKDILSPRYLFWFLRSGDTRKQLEPHIQRAINQASINQTNLKKIKILLPLLAEQKKIVARMDALTQKVRQLQILQSETAANLTALKQSILHKAFQGEL